MVKERAERGRLFKERKESAVGWVLKFFSQVCDTRLDYKHMWWSKMSGLSTMGISDTEVI